MSRMQPICSKDGVTNFYSPCHAGCRAQELLRPRDTPPDWPGAGNTSLPAARGDHHIELEMNFREDFTNMAWPLLLRALYDLRIYAEQAPKYSLSRCET